MRFATDVICFTCLKFDNNEGDEERRFDKEEHGRSSRDGKRCPSARQVSFHCQTLLLFPGIFSPSLGFKLEVVDILVDLQVLRL